MSEPEIAQPRIELGRSPCAPDVIRGRQPDQPVEGLGHVDQVDAVFTDEWVRERHPPLRLGEHCLEVDTAREVVLDSLVAAIEAVRMTSCVDSRREVT